MMNFALKVNYPECAEKKLNTSKQKTYERWRNIDDSPDNHYAMIIM